MRLIISGLIIGGLLLGGCGANVDVEKSETESQEFVSEPTYEEKAESFKAETGVQLTAKDVQYDMANNLDKEFFLAGSAELDDYYNYGYTNEKDFFSVLFTPDDGSDTWNIYFHRENGKDLFNVLKEYGSAKIFITAKIPSDTYEQGQGLMALGKMVKGQ